MAATGVLATALAVAKARFDGLGAFLALEEVDKVVVVVLHNHQSRDRAFILAIALVIPSIVGIWNVRTLLTNNTRIPLLNPNSIVPANPFLISLLLRNSPLYLIRHCSERLSNPSSIPCILPLRFGPLGPPSNQITAFPRPPPHTQCRAIAVCSLPRKDIPPWQLLYCNCPVPLGAPIHCPNSLLQRPLG